MSPSNSALLSASTGPLAARCPLAPDVALRIWRRLLCDVASSHAAGRLHGNITAETVTVNSALEASLPQPLEAVSLGSNANAFEFLPPELQRTHDFILPTAINAAAERIQQAGLDCNPRRVDVYQVGALLCRMLTGQPVAAYLQSPRARGKVPASLRGVLDGALGYDPSHRFSSIEEVQASLVSGQLENLPHRETPAVGTSSANHADTPPQGQRPSGSRASSALHQPLPERLGPYRIIERIGGGGMGDVYKAYEEALDRYVAIKVLPAELARHDDFVHRFRSEALAVAKLVHPNVVQIHAFGEDAGRYYFAMQFIRGESLADCLHRGRLTAEETLSIVEQALAGLAAAHKRGLIHRDVKPGNILLDHDHHRALLADFGLVKALEGGTSLTTTGIVMGTVDYLPPEQARGQKVDGRADLYSLGVVMYQMLSGRLPFTADSPTTMIFKHAYEQPARLAEIAPEVPQRLATIVTRLMAKNPDNRYQSAEEVIADIQKYRSGKPPATSARLLAPAAPQAVTGSSAYQSQSLEAERITDARGLRDRLLSVFRRHAPQLAAKLEDTTQQVDGAIREHERRHEALTVLLRDAEDVTAELAAQVASHQEAAREAAQKLAAAEAARNNSLANDLRHQQSEYLRTAADLSKQLANQRAHNDDLRSQLAQLAGTLQKLRSQRDVLQARLQSAQAQIEMETGRPHSAQRFRPWVVAAAVLVAMIFLCGLAIFVFKTTAPPPSALTPSIPSHLQSGDSALLAYEPFSIGADLASGQYRAGPLAGQNPTTSFFRGPWKDAAYIAYNRSGTLQKLQSAGITFPGLAVSGGSIAAGDETFSGPSGQFDINTRTYRELAYPLDKNHPGTYYISFLAGFGKYAGATGARLWEMWGSQVDEAHRTLEIGYCQYGDFGDDHTHMYLRLLDDPALADPISHSPDITSDNGRIHLFVVKVNITPSPKGDSVSVYLDPPLRTEPAVPNASISGVDFAARYLSAETQVIYPGGHSTFPDSRGAFGELRIGTSYTAVTPAASGTPAVASASNTVSPAISGRFYAVSNADFDVFINGIPLSFSNHRSDSLKLGPGDSVVVYVAKPDAARGNQSVIRLAFVSDDNEWVWSARRGQFRNLPRVTIKEIDPELIRNAQQMPSYGEDRIGLGQIWDSLKLPATNSDWIYIAGKDEWQPAGTIVQPGFFARRNGSSLHFGDADSTAKDAAAGEIKIVNLETGKVLSVEDDAAYSGARIVVSDDTSRNALSNHWTAASQEQYFKLINRQSRNALAVDLSLGGIEYAAVIAWQDKPTDDDNERWIWEPTDGSSVTIGDKSFLGKRLKSKATGMVLDVDRHGGVFQRRADVNAASQLWIDVPADAVAFGGRYYKLFSQKSISWKDARDACQQLGGHLAVAETAAEEEFVLRLAAEKPVWLGGYGDSEDGKQWKWVSGNKVNTDRIRGGAPPNLYLATAVNKRRPFEGRTLEGTFRSPEDGAQPPAFWPNIQGYICQWDGAPRSALPASQLATIENASDPKFADLFPEQGPPFAGDLSGQWKLHLPAGYEYPVKLTRLDDRHYKFQSSVSMSGVYLLRGDRLIMEQPAQPRADSSELWKDQWRIDDDSHLLLIGQIQVEKIGANYLGSTLTRMDATESPRALPPNIPGRFFVLSSGKFELFINNTQVKFNGLESDEVALNEGDVVFLHATGADNANFRGLKLDFVSTDGYLAWPGQRQDFRIVDADATETLTADTLRGITATPVLGHARSALLNDWVKVDLLTGYESEMMWSPGNSQSLECAAIVRAANFKRTTGAAHPPPTLPESTVQEPERDGQGSDRNRSDGAGTR
jgi:serine/threonine protein kinase/phage shock protein A